jgi:A/G-specific adenine glycosylase
MHLEGRQKMPSYFDTEALLAWFNEAKRDLPWREAPSAYAVWISEVMLQQTQASVVVGYFQRWMETFPTLEALSRASLDEVIKVWEGLGYYSRARNLHAAARFFVEHHKGELPRSYKELMQVKGLGRYTVGAILSFAFRQKRAAVDGNSLRVLSRYFAVREDVQKTAALERIWSLAEGILPDERPWEVVEGLIELGALVCKKEPLCSQCPLKSTCSAFRQGLQRELPYKGKRQAITALQRYVFVVMHKGDLLVRKGKAGAVMADLYEFPFGESESESPPFDLNLERIAPLSSQKHHFTRFKVLLYPTLFRAEQKKEINGYLWIPFEQLHRLPFSAGHRKILQNLNHAHLAH